MEKMVVVSFSLTKEQKAWLNNRSEDIGAPIAVFIRRALDLYIKTINEKENINERISSN